MSTLFSRYPGDLTVLANTRQQRIDMLNLRRIHNQRTAQPQSVALAFGAHLGVTDTVQIGNVRQTDSTADQLTAAVADGICPHLLQELFGITRHRQCRFAGLLVAQYQEAIGENQPQLAHILQTLLTPGSGVARPEQAR
ncbi:hypothetical protein D3C73_1019210 [compost metagenome]